MIQVPTPTMSPPPTLRGRVPSDENIKSTAPPHESRKRKTIDDIPSEAQNAKRPNEENHHYSTRRRGSRAAEMKSEESVHEEVPEHSQASATSESGHPKRLLRSRK